MDESKTQLRTRKALKTRLNAVATKAGYTAELLADLLLSDALDQIEADLMPSEILPNVKVLRGRLNKVVLDSNLWAQIERYLAARDGGPATASAASARMEALLDSEGRHQAGATAKKPKRKHG